MKSIIQNAKSITLEKSAASSKFCEVWPSVKSGLKILQSIIKNPIVKGIIDVVISAGDAVASRICK